MEFVNNLRQSFKNIWRCADSRKWHILKNYDLLTFDWLENNIDYRDFDINKLERGKRAIKPWVNQMAIGDLVFIMDKNQYYGMAIIESEYSYKEHVIDMGDNSKKPSVKVNYIHKLEKPIVHGFNVHNNPTTFAKIDAYKFSLQETMELIKSKFPEAYSSLKNYILNLEKDKPLLNLTNNASLNQIFYGPPGTGKTYNTINKAVVIANPEFDITQDRSLVRQEYDRLVIEGQIVFTTFHQSMAYEDFVEGIKPNLEKETKEVNYNLEDGIFKTLCVESFYAISKNMNTEQTKLALGFSAIFDAYIEELEGKLEKGEEIVLDTKSGGRVWVDSVSDLKNIAIKHQSGIRTYTVSKNRLSKLYGHFSDLNTVANINKEFREVIGGSNASAYWSVFNDLLKFKKNIGDDVLSDSSHDLSYEDKKEFIKNIALNEYENIEAKNYVLIIDEINRGNVSAIFGELITLLEESKRLGNEEALTVTLPYSKETFGVPNNLHIIGTMNTADRSVEALDTALRRRFVFTEMMPDVSLLKDKKVEGIELSIVLETINKRIEVLIDRDHTIGHSYFMNIFTEEQLANTFNNNIIPLLQEYFYGDYGKIGLVLGEGFVDCTQQHTGSTQLFADFKDVDDVEDFNTKVFRLKKMEAFNVIDAVDVLLNNKKQNKTTNTQETISVE